MLGVTRGSFEELLEDYKDIARRKGLKILSRDEWKTGGVRGIVGMGWVSIVLFLSSFFLLQSLQPKRLAPVPPMIPAASPFPV
jgi:hypothetical protein